MKIGISSQNFRTITGHAGKARRFFVYEADKDGVHELERIDLPKEMAIHAYSGDDHPLFDLDVLITAGCGTGFINRLARHNVTVIPTSETDPETALATFLKGEMLAPPVPHQH